MKVYLVTSGEYDDYGVHGVFSTKEQAKEYVDSREFTSSYDNYYIEPYDLDKLLNSKDTVYGDMYYVNGKLYTTREIESKCGSIGYTLFDTDDTYDDKDLTKVIKNTEEGLREANQYLEDYFNDSDIKKIKEPAYLVTYVPFNTDRSVMNEYAMSKIKEFEAN